MHERRHRPMSPAEAASLRASSPVDEALLQRIRAALVSRETPGAEPAPEAEALADPEPHRDTDTDTSADAESDPTQSDPTQSDPTATASA